MVIGVGIETALAAIAAGILLTRRSHFDGRSPMTTQGVWIYAVGACAVLVALGVAALAYRALS